MVKGDKFKTNSCGYIIIVKYVDKTRVRVRFEDGTKVWAQASNIRRGNVKNPNKPLLYNTGYFGQGDYSQKEHRKLYDLWIRMLQRCYDPKFHIKNPTYKGCTVAKRWHNFQNFCEDIEQMVGYDKLKDMWQLDKDILFRDNIHYSRKTCVLVPSYLNKILTNSAAARGDYPMGVSYSKSAKKHYKARCSVLGKEKYFGCFETVQEAFFVVKKNKEQEIKRVANLYKNELDLRAYDALMHYQIRIED